MNTNTNSNSSSDTFSIKTLSYPRSMRSETKEKFDSLLKDALKTPKKLKSPHTVHLDENQVPNKDYIMNKFLDRTATFIAADTKSDKEDEVVFIKPPIPKPRRSKKVKNDETDSQSSRRTFEIKSPKIAKTPKNDSSSDGTYVIERETVSEVGDIVVHDSPGQKIKIVSQSIESSKQHSEEHVLNSSTESNRTRVIEIRKPEVSSSESKSTPRKKPRRRTPKQDEIEKEETVVIASEEREILEQPVEASSEKSEVPETVNLYRYEHVVQVIVHKTDKLLLNSYVIHPVVKLHVVEEDSGLYLTKSDKDRAVVSFYEGGEMSYISPVMTHAFSLQQKRSMIPFWEESIIINEDYEYFQNQKILIFFEIMDFLPISVLASESGNSKGWHRIAFAFLKPRAKNGASNLGVKLRLQLYYVTSFKREPSQKCYLWNLWRSKKLTKYPSTLYVTIMKMVSPRKIIDVLRSKTPVQQEKFSHRAEEEAPGKDTSSDVIKTLVGRKIGNATGKLPNKVVTKISTNEAGCFTLKFSHDGSRLAASVCLDDVYSILLYTLESGDEEEFPCHQGLIYSICWSLDDKFVAAASADNTVSLWDLEQSCFLQILPHPSFVYACETLNDNSLTTGCYDGIVRIWSQINREGKIAYGLTQELSEHETYVISVCVDNKSNVIYSADADGIIIIWQKIDKEWVLRRKMLILEIRATIINQIQIISKNKRMLIHTRDRILRIIDIKTSVIIHRLYGGLNQRVQTSCSVSPDETFIISGSENSQLNIWKKKTGKYLGCIFPYGSLNTSLAIHCVQFHPTENTMAVCHYGSSAPILILSFDENSENELEMNLVEPDSDKSSVGGERAIEKFSSTPKKLTTPENLNLRGILDKLDEVIKAQKKS